MLLHVLLSSNVQAETYTVDFPVVRSAPVENTDGQFLAIMAWDVAQGYPNQSVASDWSYVVCEVLDGDFLLKFEAERNAWPSSFPPTATCSAGGYTLVANLVAAPMDDDYDLDFSPSVGIIIDSAPNVGFTRTYRLPTGQNYTTGTAQARLSPSTPWPGVNCGMAVGGDGQPYFQISARPTAPADEGYCILRNAAGVPHAVAVTIAR
jgi:hypothetical protein